MKLRSSNQSDFSPSKRMTLAVQEITFKYGFSSYGRFSFPFVSSEKATILPFTTAKCIGREEGIRTLDTLLAYTHFPGVRLRPLGHLSILFCPENLLCQDKKYFKYPKANTSSGNDAGHAFKPDAKYQK